MTARFRIPLMAALLGLATLGAGRQAEAALRLNITVYDGGGNQLATTGDLTNSQTSPSTGFTRITYEGILGDVLFDFDVQATTNDPGTPGRAFLNLGARIIDNLTNQVRSILVIATADGFKDPRTAPLEHSLSATVNVQDGTFTGDPATALGLVQATGSPIPLSSIATKPLSASGISQGTSDNPSPKSITTNLPSTYTMVTQFGGRLGANATVATGTDLAGFSVSHQVMPMAVAVPEPSTIATAGVGVVLSLGMLRRRNRA